MRTLTDESVHTPEQHTEELRDTVPLAFALEGKSWGLTTVLHAAISLWMIETAFEGSELLDLVRISDSNFASSLLQYLLYILTAVLGAVIGVYALTLNLRNTDQNNWRWQSFQSTIALLLINAIAVYDSQAIVRSMISTVTSGPSKAEWISLVARGFLWISGTCFIFIFDCLFVQQFGVCICWRGQQHGQQKILSKMSTWSSVWTYSKCFKVKGRNSTDNGAQEDGPSNSSVPLEPEPSSSLTDAVCVLSIPEEQNSTRVESEGNSQNALNSSMTHGCYSDTSSLRIYESSSHPLESVSSREPLLGVSESHQDPPDLECSRDTCVGEGSSSRTDIRRTMRKYSQSGKLKINSVLGSVQRSVRNMWNKVKEEKGVFRYHVWFKSTFFTSVVTLIYACIKTISIVVSLVEQYNKQRFKIETHMEKLDDFLNTAGWMDGVDGISRTTIIRLCLIVEKVIQSYEWIAVVGYPIGAMIGMCSLLTILMQYKKESMKLAPERHEQPSQSGNEGENNSQWVAFHEQYPVLGAYAFMGIVLSTVVVQAQIAAVLICLMLGLLWNIPQLWFVLRYLGPFLIVYLLIFLIDVFAMRILKYYLMKEDGKEIKHPRGFNFFMIVLSMVHMITGLMNACWRVVYSVVTTVSALNRLDVSLLAFAKKLDNGHNAFMSMMALNVLTQQDTQHFVETGQIKLGTFKRRQVDTGIDRV